MSGKIQKVVGNGYPFSKQKLLLAGMVCVEMNNTYSIAYFIISVKYLVYWLILAKKLLKIAIFSQIFVYTSVYKNC